ncbi:MAG: POTRA domain-containing protein [Desulfosalsimonadaceae bacterium]
MAKYSNPAWLFLVVMAWFFALPGLTAAVADSPAVEDIRIEITAEAGDPEKLCSIAEGLIVLEEGEAFTEEKFSRSVEALERSGLFSDIDIAGPGREKSAVCLVFRLTPFSRIKEIKIHGGFPLLEKEIRNVMSIATGDAFRPELLSGQASKIEALFSDEGYIRPRVRMSAKKDPADGNTIVRAEIRKGPFYSVEAFEIKGNEAFSDLRLQMRLDTWQAAKLWGAPSRFTREKLREDVKTLRRFYRSKGYCDVSLETSVEKDRHSASVRVRILVSEGPRYKVDFSGNQAFWDFTLQKELLLFTEGNQSGFGMQKSLRNIRKRYRLAGFPDVQLRIREPENQKADQAVRRLTIAIVQGPRYIVNHVSISGNQAFSEEKIRKQMITRPPGLIHDGRYVEQTLEDDIRAIKALYLEQGFRNTGVSCSTNTEPAADKSGTVAVEVTVSIEESPRTVVRSVSVEGVAGMGLDKPCEGLILEPGVPYRQFLLQSEKSALAGRISEKGYPHVSVEPKVTISPDGTAADIVYTVRPGPYVEMGRSFFTGNFKTRERVLDREMTISAGEAFSLSRLLASQRNIRSLNVVDTARFKTFGLAEKAGEVDMLAEIREKKPYFVSFAAGYDTRRLSYCRLTAGNSNLTGLNKELRTDLEWSQIGYRAELRLSGPRFFGSRIATNTNLYTETLEELHKDFGFRTHGASLGFSRKLSKNLSASLNFHFESREQYLIDGVSGAEAQQDAYDPRAVLVAAPSLSYNSTNSFVRPTRGARVSFSVDVSKGVKDSLDDFFKYRLEGRYYYSPFQRLTLATRGRIDYIDPFGEKSRIPEDQLFFLGGISDVRGFSENRLRFDAEEDPVGGRTALLASLEARFDIGMNFELAAFYDTGAVRDSIIDAGSDEFRSSAGLALRYITPIGPLSAMYGWKLDRKPEEGPGQFHFALGYTF